MNEDVGMDTNIFFLNKGMTKDYYTIIKNIVICLTYTRLIKVEVIFSKNSWQKNTYVSSSSKEIEEAYVFK